MIVTHSNKFLTPKSKVVGGVLNSALDIPDFFISSNHVSQSKKYWANPISAAYYREAKEMAERANKEGAVENCFPDFVDGFTKQLFLKTNKGYIVHSPLTSCSLVDEFTTKAREYHKNLISKYLALKEDRKTNKYTQSVKFFGSGYFDHQIQPSGVTLGNRGELAVKHGGRFFIKSTPFLGAFKSHSKINLNENRKHLFFYGSLDGVNLNSGFISSGVPALTAIGGMIESIELKLNYDNPIPFAFGLKNHSMSKGGKLSTTFSKDRKIIPQLVLEEKNGSLDFVIVLDVTNFDFDDIKNELLKINRLAGGSIFNYNVSNEITKELDEYFFIRKFTTKMAVAIKSGDVVSYIISHKLHPVACGYALLQEPNSKEGVRLDKISNQKYNHAFSETLFLPVRMSKRLDHKSFFQRQIYKNCTAYI